MEIIYYKTLNYGGIEGTDVKTLFFENVNIAKLEALKNNWNSRCKLYKVTMKLDGTISFEEEYLGEIKCWADIYYEYLYKSPKKSKEERDVYLKELLNTYFSNYEQALNDFRNQRKLTLNQPTQ